MARILAIDDEPAILSLVRNTLAPTGNTVDTATDPRTITPEQARLYDLILLDVMMPGEDGFAFCARVRPEVDCPIVFLTAKPGEEAAIEGLGLGADDFLRKPFSIGELRARVAAHLRRQTRSPSHSIQRGGIRFDLAAKQAFAGNEALPFTKGEYAIAAALMRHPGQVFSKEQLYELAFGYDAQGDASAVTEHIKNIRAKLRRFGLEPIETVWGVGYRWKNEKA